MTNLKMRWKSSSFVRILALFSSVFICSTIGYAQSAEWISLRPSSQSRTATTMAAEALPAEEGVSVATNAPGQFKATVQVDGFWKRARTAQPAAQSKKPALNTPDASEHFDAIHIPGWTTLREVGVPAVPIRRLLFALPPGSTGATVRVHSKTDVVLDSLRIIPAQPPYPDVFPEPPRPAFQMDAQLYQSSSFYPPDVVVTTALLRIRDQTLCAVEVAAIRFVPETGEAVAASELELDVQADLDAAAAEEETDEEPAATALPIYMILMDDQFAANTTLNTFIDWKKRKGYDVRTVKTSQIDASGAPTNGQIVAYMRGLAASNYPAYLLIIGDHTAANGVQGAYFSTDMGGYTDLDIACRTASDWIPDLFHGRLPATNNTSATRMLEKILAADRNPPTNDVFSRVVIAGQIQDSDDHNNRADRLFCETGDALASFFEHDPSSNTYACTRAVVNPDGMTAEGYWNEDSILWGSTDQIGDRIFTNFVSVATAQARINANVNAGAVLLFHRDHGYSNGVGWADPQYIYTHVRALTNGMNRPVVFSINCASGAYHQPNNFTRAWMEQTNGGAYAVFAPVDISYSWNNDWFTHGLMTACFTNYISFQNACTDPEWTRKLPAPSGSYGAAGSAPRLGEVMNFAKMYLYEKYEADKTTFRLFHVFGDPEAALITHEPEPLTVSHPPLITLGTTTAVNVSISQTGALVCLYSASLGIHERRVTETSNTSFSITAGSAGTIAVTVTKPGFRPCEGTLSVVGSEDFSLRATALTNSVILRWTDPLLCGMPNRQVNITASTNTWPETSSDGTSIYTGTNQVYENTDLLPGQTYFYTLWIHDGTGWTNPPGN